MLAAGGHGATVHLWDARASARSAMALPLQSSTVITSILCSPATHTIAAGSSRGGVHAWDIRAAGRSSAHVLSGRGLAQAAPAATLHLPAAAADHPTALAYATQLRLCVGCLGAGGAFPTEGPAETETAAAGGAGDGGAVAGCSGRLGMARSAALAAAGRASAVERLVQDPGDQRRVAFALACGGAGAFYASWPESWQAPDSALGLHVATRHRVSF